MRLAILALLLTLTAQAQIIPATYPAARQAPHSRTSAPQISRTKEGKTMNEEMQKQLLARLDVVGAKLGVAASHLWSLFVRQSYIDGFESLAILVVMVSFCPWVMRRAKAMGDREMGSYRENVACPVLWVAFAILVILSVVSLVSAVDHLANPQLWAFRSIMESVK